jgi:type II secretory pathway component PulF
VDTPADAPEVVRRSEAATAWKRWLTGPGLGNRVLLHEEIASLVGAGIGIREALADLRDRSTGRRRRALERLADAVAHGVPPGRALAAMPEAFSPAEAAIVAAGDRTGRLDQAFREAAAEVERARQALGRLVRSIAYPLFLVHFALFVPACSVMQMRSGPATARMFVWTTFLLMWTAILGVWTLHVAHRRDVGWGRTVARLPFVGDVVASGALSRAGRVAAAVHGAGTTLPDTLHAAADAAGNGWIEADLRAAAERIREGSTATEALVRVEALSSAARSLVETGEKTGTLDLAFGRIAQIEDERFTAAARRLSVALAAALMVLVGLVVFWLLASVLGKAFGRF